MTLTEMLANMADANAKFRPQARAEWSDAIMLELMEVFTPERLAEVFAAEREGRCVVLDETGVAGKLTALPCNVGDTAFALLDDSNEPGGWYICEYRVWGVCLKDDGWYLLDRDGNADKVGTDYAYLTRAEAEEKLRQKGATDEL